MAKIKAFGTEYPVDKWAEFLGMDAVDVSYYTEMKGLTIEDLYRIQGRKAVVKKPERKPRTSEAMIRTKERMSILLEYSGIADRSDRDEIEVRRVGTHTHHAIIFRGKHFGVYNYKTGALTLSNGDGIPLWDYDYEDVKVQIDAEGLWSFHPDTKKLMLKRILKQPTEADFEEEREHYRLRAQANEMRESTAVTYDGFGKSHTCAEWARILGVPRNTLWRHLQKGQTIEGFATERGIK